MDNIILGALAVPYRKTNKNYEFLLLKHQKGIWTFPGGMVEQTDRSLKDCLVRELKEEIGLEINKNNLINTKLKNEFIYDSVKPERAGKKGVTHFYLLQLNGDEKFKSFDKKIADNGWFITDKILELLPYKHEKNIFKMIINNSDKFKQL